ncbi:anti-sigma factor [Flavobacteriaceae bacterium R38]|nr:anti-sigma factor [Flavobacteriaceae bacterium R38]
MNVKEYIESGILELYVAGALSPKENEEVYEATQKYPEIKNEVEEIEKALGVLSTSIMPVDIPIPFDVIKKKIEEQGETAKVIPLEAKKTNWIAYTGWAASIILAAGLFWMVNQNNELSSDIKSQTLKNAVLEQQIVDANANLDEATALINLLREKDITPVGLGGQAVAPDAYAKVYVKKGDTKVYIDALGLPEPPEGKVYQVWSLKLNPLTPTSIGLLEDFAEGNKVFELENDNESEAFGITLEPAGGSESPTLEQLYTLGVISATP